MIHGKGVSIYNDNKILELLHTLDAVCPIIHAFEEKILNKMDWQDETIATLEKEGEEYVFFKTSQPVSSKSLL